MQRALRNDLVDADEIRKVTHAIPILVVPGEVLDHRDHMFFLDRRYFGGRHLAIQKWIFPEGLRRAAPMPGAQDVQRGSDNFRTTLSPPLLSECLPEIRSAIPIPGRGQGNLIRKRRHSKRGGWRRTRYWAPREPIGPIRRVKGGNRETIRLWSFHNVADLLLKVHRVNHLEGPAFRRLLPVAPRLTNGRCLAVVESRVRRLGSLPSQGTCNRKQPENRTPPRPRSTHRKYQHDEGTPRILCFSCGSKGPFHRLNGRSSTRTDSVIFTRAAPITPE